MTSVSTLIVGGGISGLTVAYDLHRQGVDVTLVEREKRLGGLIWTRKQDGFLMEMGPDAFLTQKPQAKKLCEEVGLGSELISTNTKQRRVYVLQGGQLQPLPEGMRLTVPTRLLPLLASSFFSFGGKLRLMCERFVSRRKGDDEESIAEFVSRRFGREALERVGEPLLAGIHCGDASKLSMDALFPGFVEMERRFGSVTKAMLRSSASAGEGRRETVFASLEGGMTRLIEGVSAQLPATSLMRERTVTEISRKGQGFVSKLSSGEEITSRSLVVALPVRASEKLLRTLSAEAGRVLSEIPAVSTAVVFHAFARHAVSHALDGYGFVVPRGESSRLLAATFMSTKFSGRAPSSRVLLRTFLGGPRDPDALKLSDEDLIRLSRIELSGVLGSMGEPDFSTLQRWTERTPQVELGHRGKIRALDEQLQSFPGLYVIGNGLGSVGIPDCVGAARETADSVLSFLNVTE